MRILICISIPCTLGRRSTFIATDSKITADAVIIRYDAEEVIAFTVLHTSKR